MPSRAWILLIKAIIVASACVLFLVMIWRYPYVMRTLLSAIFEGSPIFAAPMDFVDQQRCPIFAYFVPLKDNANRRKNSLGIEGYSEMTAMLALWMRNWFHHGKDPRILTLSDAQKYPEFGHFDMIFRSFPTINNPNYEIACYHRWLALAAVGGGTLMDFDILAMDPFDFGKGVEESCGRSAPLTSYLDYEPMLTHGSAEEIRRFINVLATYQLQPDDKVKGMPHISDMLITRKCRSELFGSNYVRESKPAIHFSSEQMTQFRDAVNELTGSAHPWSRQVGRTWLMNRVAQLQYTNRHSILILAPPGSDDQVITSLMAPLIDPWDSDDKLIIDTFAKQSWVREVRGGQHVASNSLLKRGAFTQSVTWLTQLPPNGLDFMDEIPGAVLFIWLTDPVKRVLQRYEEEKHFEQRHSRPRNSMSIALNALDHQTNVLNEVVAEKIFEDKRVFIGFVDDIGGSRLVLEYFTGCLLRDHDEEWYRARRRASNSPSKEQRRVFETYEHNDVALYQLARRRFEGMKRVVDKVEARLNPFLSQ